jgi:hypothetical protein
LDPFFDEASSAKEPTPPNANFKFSPIKGRLLRAKNQKRRHAMQFSFFRQSSGAEENQMPS